MNVGLYSIHGVYRYLFLCRFLDSWCCFRCFFRSRRKRSRLPSSPCHRPRPCFRVFRKTRLHKHFWAWPLARLIFVGLQAVLQLLPLPGEPVHVEKHTPFWAFRPFRRTLTVTGRSSSSIIQRLCDKADGRSGGFSLLLLLRVMIN